MKNKELVNLKRQKTKLLNKECINTQEFNEVQEKLNEIEFKIKLINER